MDSTGDIPERVAHYQLEHKLGEGAMGVVYRALDTQLQRPVALKLIAGAGETAERRARILREARAASALNHPNICTVYGVGDDGPHTYIVLELIEGQSLAKRLVRGPLDDTEWVSIARQIADALRHAHDRGVIHRDLKSENVVLTTDDRPKVLDFGLARVMAPDTDPEGETILVSRSGTDGMIVGTLPYMSPEVLRGAPPSTCTDLWAFGVMMFHMATGALPFRGRTAFELSAAILRGEPPMIPAGVSPRVAGIISRALDPNEAQRFPGAESISKALDALTSEGDRSVPLVPARAVRSLVVLPLVNLSGDPDQEYFADGLTEAVTSAIASVRELRVVSRTSAMRYKQSDKPLPEIARELRVDAVVEGSVLRSGERVRVSAQLIRGDTDEHMWTGTYDRDARDVLELQMEVSRAIVKEIEVALSPKERARLEAVDAVDPDAYEAFMRGRHGLAERNRESLEQAITHFQEAISKAPEFAPAYASLAECYNVLGFQGARSPRDSYRIAGAVARNALVHDAELASAHISLAYTALHHDQRWSESEDAFKKGLRLDPRDATAHHWYALYHSSVGRHGLAITTIESARDLDPLSLIIGTAVGLVHQFAREYDAALREYRRVLEDDPNFWAAVVWHAIGLTHAGDAPKAMKSLGEVLESFGRAPVVVAAYGEAAARAGREHEARAALDELEVQSRHRYVRPYDRAKVLSRLGEYEQALDQLDLALAEGGNWLNYLRVDPSVDPLRGQPRFEALLLDVYRTAPDADGP